MLRIYFKSVECRSITLWKQETAEIVLCLPSYNNHALTLEQTAWFNARKSLAVQGRLKLTFLCAVYGVLKHHVILNHK